MSDGERIEGEREGFVFPIGTVTYKASFTRADGGWDHMEVAMNLNADPAQIDQAFQMWDYMRGQGQNRIDALRAPDRAPRGVSTNNYASARKEPNGGRAAPEGARRDDSMYNGDAGQVLLKFGKYAGMTVADADAQDPDGVWSYALAAKNEFLLKVFRKFYGQAYDDARAEGTQDRDLPPEPVKPVKTQASRTVAQQRARQAIPQPPEDEEEDLPF